MADFTNDQTYIDLQSAVSDIQGKINDTNTAINNIKNDATYVALAKFIAGHPPGDISLQLAAFSNYNAQLIILQNNLGDLNSKKTDAVNAVDAYKNADPATKAQIALDLQKSKRTTYIVIGVIIIIIGVGAFLFFRSRKSN